ncbi:hypothetical protein DEJ30_13870 [Curtobacterium sp. MCPF17_003]|uniref:hypothetical protein n=1 Tax=unclassified Curtobacterium TaxID=257496 RepID=UPI000D8DCE01|nr:MULTISPECIES: hypothetical protein [unclassified Curtobacterium]PYY63332.1 hypothetical protein DEJ30_13870 [Curtobacterium sp. MCPF17_003]PZE65591.1 hypothetical protein DEJ27_14515 [Curtobacterium sp. MCPF17_018]
MEKRDKRRPRALAFKKDLGAQFSDDPMRTRAAQVAPRLLGAAKASATRTHTAGGSTANGGLRKVGAEPVPSQLGTAREGLFLASRSVPIECGVARTISPQSLPVARIVDLELRDAELDERGGSEWQAVEVLTESWPPVIELAAEELAADTIVMPVVGDRVHYSRGSGHLIGLQGVVVASDDGRALPRGLRSVQLDDEAWPVVVAVVCLDRI